MGDLRKELFSVLTLTLLFGVLSTSCLPIRSFNRDLWSIIRPYHFHTLAWELKTIFGSAMQEAANPKPSGETRVLDYFETVDSVKKIRSEIAAIQSGNQTGDFTALNNKLSQLQGQIVASQGAVEDMLEKQLRATLTVLGLFNPFESAIKLKFSFPPLDFKLDSLPHLLVVSPRDIIENIRSVSLRQDMTVEDIERIESAVDELGVSSLVVNLGGFSGTYPTLVTNEASLRFTLDAASEEWLHQYLAFKPLGFRYILSLTGLRRNYEIATMNETVASMLGKEIGGIVIQKYYPDVLTEDLEKDKNGFDFNREMRETRKAVDNLLADRKIAEAEKLMAEKRQYLAANRHYIRKLNQAYFAFYGTYADRPDSVSPIGAEMKQLRDSSASLKDPGEGSHDEEPSGPHRESEIEWQKTSKAETRYWKH
jgi:hypothetical protein